MNILTKGVQPDLGKIVVGDTVKIGYYTQNGIEVKPDQKVIDVIKEFGEYIPLTKGKIISCCSIVGTFPYSIEKSSTIMWQN